MPEFNRGQDGAIDNFMDDIAEAARHSNGFVLEIGVATGTGSTIAIQEGLASHPDPLHVSVDYQDRMVVKPEVPWWHLVIGDSRSPETVNGVLWKASLPDGCRLPGLIFIDTDHDYDQMRPELATWSPLATPETVWLFHDTWMFGVRNESMIRAIEEFAKPNGWRYEDFRAVPHGLGRMTKA
jgi:cephalosporin hydroxylase